MASNLVFDFRHHYETGERRASEPCAYQYDQGHIAKVYVPETADEFEMHYAWGDFPLSEGYTVDDVEQADDGGYVITAHIPNDLFERSGELRVYVVASDTNSIITTYEGYIFIKNRVQPDDYVDDDPDNHATKILDEAQRYATKSESFAVGGTGTRLGEDTDNAKYYLEQAEEVAESIPEDYSELSDDVVDLKDAVFDQHTGIATKAPAIYCTASGSLVTIPDGADSMPVKSLTVAVQPVQAGTGDPSPQNIRSISGWTGCKAYRTGKNLYDASQTLLSGYLNANGSVSGVSGSTNKHTYKIPVKSGATYTYSVAITFGTATRICCVYDANDSVIDYFELAKNATKVTHTMPENAVSVSLSLYNPDGQQIMFESWDSADPYEAYNGETYDIAFPSEAGTVYGAKIDPMNGKLVNDGFTLAFTGTEGWTKVSGTGSGKAYYRSEVSAVTAWKDLLESKCSHYPKVTIAASNAEEGFSPINSGTYGTLLAFRPDLTTYDTVTKWKDYLAAQYANGTPVTVFCRTTDSVTYNIDPVTIRTLLGLNNIWADTGAIEECVYAADTKMYIEEFTKPTEDDMVANAAIESGKFFMINNRLFLSTASIANGATINPGTNCTELSLSEALNTLNT